MKIFATLALGAVMTACSYSNVKSRTDDQADLKSYKTYNFMDVELQGAERDSVTNTAMNEIKQAVAREMNARGYQTYGKPDLLINIGLVIQEKTQTRQTDIREAPRYIGQRRYSWKSETVPVGQYKEGTLSVELVDAQQNKMVWDAVGSTVLNKRSRQPEQIDKAVGKLFDKFPVPVK
ncbi:hypothetical protein BWI93_03695 [Siphonobacter sp. BAB-5385]|uniref:DUF4136 domain-containing protein n=1 Tax=Siphonobacter sp. BAB-5385 TaxID=1864822 RepID=UPI000B9E2B7C|nr:DUF4136 domain-containing protein [Siphonobacter sp. BAB-5385]OZI09480.1 hypothetical protein BWI93_03695 [Siphonobacter sp. BAB-5385]